MLNRRVDLHAIDATPGRWRGDAGSSLLDGASAATSSPRNDLVKNYRAPTHWLISTQVLNDDMRVKYDAYWSRVRRRAAREKRRAQKRKEEEERQARICLLYTSPSPRDQRGSRMPSSA